jgi:hypothetical protein
VLNLTAEDLQPFRVPRDGGAVGSDAAPPLPLPLPLPVPKPPGDEQPITPGAAPAVPGGPVTPVTPPKPIKPPKF